MNNKKNTILVTSILIAFCAISSLPYFIMCLCCFSTSADIKGNIILIKMLFMAILVYYVFFISKNKQKIKKDFKNRKIKKEKKHSKKNK